MAFHYETATENVDWRRVRQLLYHLSPLPVEQQKIVFERSYARSFLYDDDYLIGVGRALSDGVCQAAIYNISVDEAYQGQQLGRGIIQHLIDQVPGCTVILYTHPQTVSMYEKFGFRRMKTGMMTWSHPDEKFQEGLKFQEEAGFLFPEGTRFQDNPYEKLPYGAVTPPEMRLPPPGTPVPPLEEM
jgi:GNAT superfamily N-acetyltransferase